MPSTQEIRRTEKNETPTLDATVKSLILQSLAHEKGGVEVYTTALECALNEDLKEEWTEYLEQTKHHVEVLTSVCEALGLDPEEPHPACKVVETVGTALVAAMKQALEAGDPDAAQLVACECVVLAETKDHLDWELLGEVQKTTADEKLAATLKKAVDEVEDEEDEHLYHTKGWCRELWLDALGLEAELPPPEEEKDVKTALAQAKVEATRKAKAAKTGPKAKAKKSSH